VQRRELDGHAADVDRLEHGERVQVAELADIPHDVLELGDLRRRRGTSSAIAQRGSRPTTPEPALSSKSSTFTDDAVDLEVERALGRSCQDEALRHDLVLGVESADVAVDAEAVRAQPLQRLPVRPELQAPR
jgi:hypothetical protein